MTKIDHDKLQRLVKELYSAVGELERMFPGRHFTPDSHMLGSLGECLVADAYGLELLTASNKGHDPLTPSGKRAEIKATQGSAVALRSEPEHTIAIRILPDGSFAEMYNGPGNLVWEQFGGKRLPSKGQYQISLSRLKGLGTNVSEMARISRRV